MFYYTPIESLNSTFFLLNLSVLCYDFVIFRNIYGQFDFPQKKKGVIIGMYLVGAILSSKKIKAKMGNAMNDGMIMSHRKVIEDLKNK